MRPELYIPYPQLVQRLFLFAALSHVLLLLTLCLLVVCSPFLLIADQRFSYVLEPMGA